MNDYMNDVLFLFIFLSRGFVDQMLKVRFYSSRSFSENVILRFSGPFFKNEIVRFSLRFCSRFSQTRFYVFFAPFLKNVKKKVGHGISRFWPVFRPF